MPARRSNPNPARVVTAPTQELAAHRLPAGARIDIVASTRRLSGGARLHAGTDRQIAGVLVARQRLRTLTAPAAGLRAPALFALAPVEERAPNRRPAGDDKLDGRPGRDYTVEGKEGLVRAVRLRTDLAG